ncbi:hypothetical protein ACFQ0M_43150 [Kitasatospora aburaviensis]
MLTESGWKFIEFNFCSATGGQVFTHLLNDLWRQLLPGRTADSLVLADPMAARNELLRGVLAEYGLEPRLALIGYLPDVFVTDRRYYEIEIDALRRAGSTRSTSTPTSSPTPSPPVRASSRWCWSGWCRRSGSTPDGTSPRCSPSGSAGPPC